MAMGLVPTVPTTSGSVLEAVPATPLRTATLKVPALLSVTGPTTCVVVLVVSRLFAIMHGAQLVPVSRICMVAGSKLLPFTVKVNCWPAKGLTGEVTRPVIDGFGVPIDTERVLEGVPAAPFRTD